MSRQQTTLTGSELVTLLSAAGTPVISNRLTGLVDVTVEVPHGLSGILCRGKCDGIEVAVRTIRLFVSPNNTTYRMLEVSWLSTTWQKAVINPERMSFEQIAAGELKRWHQLRHDHLLPLWGLACIQGQAALVSPWVPNGRILDFLRKSPSTNPLKMCTELASVVAYLHSNGVVHQKLQAKNILVSQTGNVRLVGFGTSTLKELGRVADRNLCLRWTPPEIFGRNGTYTTATDVWTLGMTILEIFTKLHPYAMVKHDQDVISKITGGTIPTRPVEFAGYDQLWALLVRCWSYDPRSRPSAAAVYDALRKMTQGKSSK